MRLIDADALFSWGKYKLSDATKYGNRSSARQQFSYSTMMMYEIADEIDDAPTIDAAPVVRGEWIEFPTTAYNGTDDCGEPKWISRKYFRCNKCRTGTAVRTRYCPSCGARMEEV